MIREKITGLQTIAGSLKPVEPELPDSNDENTIKIVFGTSGEYPDGSKWDREATPDEEAEYKSWCE